MDVGSKCEGLLHGQGRGRGVEIGRVVEEFLGGEHEEGEGTELPRGAGMREGESWGGESESGIGGGE